MRIGAVVAFVVALFITAGATGNAGSGDGTQIFLATFTGVADGPAINGTVPAEVGRITVTTSNGRSPCEVVPKTGVCSERLLISDVGTSASTDITARFAPTGDAANGAMLTMVLRQETDCTSFGGDVSDGATTDMLCFDVCSGTLTVNGVPLATKIRTGTDYELDFGLFSSKEGDDSWEVWITNLDTGDAEHVTGLIEGGYRPVHSIEVVKHAGKAGAFSVDSIAVVGLQH